MTHKTYQKQKPFRSRKYLDWVKRGIDMVNGFPAQHPHHLKGYGHGGSVKADDRLTMPMTMFNHTAFHNDHVGWESVHGSQLDYIEITLDQARKEGQLTDKLINEALLMIQEARKKYPRGLAKI